MALLYFQLFLTPIIVGFGRTYFEKSQTGGNLEWKI